MTRRRGGKQTWKGSALEEMELSKSPKCLMEAPVGRIKNRICQMYLKKNKGKHVNLWFYFFFFFNIMFISLYKSLSVCKRFSIQYFSSKIRLSIGQLSIN